MLKKLEEIFGFRTNHNTNIAHYLKRMDEMCKLDDVKQNELIVALINGVMTQGERIDSLEQLAQIKTDKLQELEDKLGSIKPVKVKDHTQELSTIKADITRIKKKVYPSK
ncbi:MAG: hypothetical protein GY861_03200 [bacterium]|nr:hypothetical protein [bacterium]